MCIRDSEYTAVIFTARTAIDHFFRLCEELRVTIPETMKYFCTTEAIALYLQKYIIYRKRKIFFGNSGKLDDLVPSLLKHSGEKFLFPVSDVHKEQTSVLEKHKINYTKAIMYRTVSNDFGPDEPFDLSLIHISEPTRQAEISYAVFCLKKKKKSYAWKKKILEKKKKQPADTASGTK